MRDSFPFLVRAEEHSPRAHSNCINGAKSDKDSKGRDENNCPTRDKKREGGGEREWVNGERHLELLLEQSLAVVCDVN